MELRPNAERAKLAIILIWATLAIEVISVISDYFQYRLISGMVAGEPIDMGLAESNDMRQRLIGITAIIVLIVSAIIYVRWFRRAFYNLETKTRGLQFSNNDAASCWFIPLLNLYKPFQIMDEMYRRTEILLSEQVKDYKASFTFYNIRWWWAFWILHNIAGQIVFRMAMAAETADEILNATIFSMVTGLINIPLALIAILVIQDYTEKENLLASLKNESDETIDTEIDYTLQPET
jgi:hypothetical protein